MFKSFLGFNLVKEYHSTRADNRFHPSKRNQIIIKSAIDRVVKCHGATNQHATQCIGILHQSCKSERYDQNRFDSRYHQHGGGLWCFVCFGQISFNLTQTELG